MYEAIYQEPEVQTRGSYLAVVSLAPRPVREEAPPAVEEGGSTAV